MSESRDTFFDLYVRGEALAEEIDDYVDFWHGAAEGSPAAAHSLPTFLGLTDAEYAAWVENPGALPAILSYRVIGSGDVAAANDDMEVHEFRLAARAGSVDLIGLRAWIRQRSK